MTMDQKLIITIVFYTDHHIYAYVTA